MMMSVIHNIHVIFQDNTNYFKGNIHDQGDIFWSSYGLIINFILINENHFLKTIFIVTIMALYLRFSRCYS